MKTPTMTKVWRRQWHPTPVLLPGKSHGRRSLVGCSPWGREESDTTEWLHFHYSLSCIGEGNGNPLQCSWPGESQGRRSLVGCCLWGRTESDTTEATWQQQQHDQGMCPIGAHQLPQCALSVTSLQRDSRGRSHTEGVSIWGSSKHLHLNFKTFLKQWSWEV